MAHSGGKHSVWNAPEWFAGRLRDGGGPGGASSGAMGPVVRGWEGAQGTGSGMRAGPMGVGARAWDHAGATAPSPRPTASTTFAPLLHVIMFPSPQVTASGRFDASGRDAESVGRAANARALPQ